MCIYINLTVLYVVLTVLYVPSWREGDREERADAAGLGLHELHRPLGDHLVGWDLGR